MKKLYHIFLFLVTINSYTIFANNIVDYRLEKTNQLSNVEKEVFLNAFLDNYQDISPKKLNSTFKGLDDIRKWLLNIFHEEKKHLEHNNNVYVVSAKTPNNETIGIGIFEVLQDGKENIIHIRQMAIQPQWQGKNVGTKIYFYIRGPLKDNF